MKTRKAELRFFDVMDYEKEAEYLSQRHREGWKFTGVMFPGFYHFVACEPEEVCYQLDYNKDGTENLEEYRQMFTDLGWEYLFDYVGYSYFRKARKDMDRDEEIFCDEDSRFDMMKRIFMGRMIPLVLLFCFVILPSVIMTFIGGSMGHPMPKAFGGMMMILFFVYLAIFVKFTAQYIAFKKKIGR